MQMKRDPRNQKRKTPPPAMMEKKKGKDQKFGKLKSLMWKRPRLVMGKREGESLYKIHSSSVVVVVNGGTERGRLPPIGESRAFKRSCA